MKSLVCKGFGIIFLLFASLLPGQEQYAGNPDNGKRLFVQNGCYECHGYVGQGGGAGSRIANTRLSAEALIGYVRHPAGQMPLYTKQVMSDNELTDVWAYLKSLPAPRPVKDLPLLGDSHTK
jgi:mono/diheme cytochrome c family protein